ncbi:MAG TPA: hypothetical protein VMI75_28195 [Polyangiaceae bacterium]|nr:hypothetical protein [Polyangiaceae bacterium]
MIRELTRLGTTVAAAFPVALCACGNASGGSNTPANAQDIGATGLSTQSVEWVSYHSEVPFAEGDFHALAAGLFGRDAQNGKPVTNREITPGIYLSSAADPSTPEQAIVTLKYDDGSGSPRALAVVPTSFAVGNVYVTTIDAALAKIASDVKANQAQGESFFIQYQVTSAMGGTFSFGVRANGGVYTLVLDVSSPTTNLAPGNIGKPALSNIPYDTVAGTVWFSLTQDDFDYFVSHAYGKDATAAQNFNDFALVPFDWLRLSVDPHLQDQYVNVSFSVLGVDGSRTPVASAPASVLAGNTFQTLVDHSMSTMTAQEKAKTGSSTPWTIPFYYDNPVGGGVVQVIAQGNAGQFNIAYSVSAPAHTLQDVSFLPYKPVHLEPPSSTATAACNKLGNAGIVLADNGVFDITFTASDQVLKSPMLKGPLVGDILCSVFKATDVTVAGPKMGAVSLQDFTVVGANMQSKVAPKYMTQELPDGTYQILCFQDLKGDHTPDVGDPVTLPIGSFPIACNLNPVTVQFALLNPMQE